MNTEKNFINDKANLIACFKDAAILKKKLAGICIKYSMYDATDRLFFFRLSPLNWLQKCLEYFSAMHYYESDMQRAADDFSFAATLAPNHAIHTMKRMTPIFGDADFTSAQINSASASWQSSMETKHASLASHQPQVSAEPTYCTNTPP
jgi:hypothetical protein